MTPDTPAWSRQIRWHTLSLILLVAVIGFAATGYVLWSKKSSENFLIAIDGYHLASAFHSAAAREEAHRIIDHGQSQEPISADGFSAGIMGADGALNMSAAWSILRGQINALIALQERERDPRFAFLTQKIRDEFAAVDVEHPVAATSPLPKETMLHLQSLALALKQTERLHVIVRDELKAQRDRERSTDLIVLLAFVVAMAAVGFFYIRKGMHAIDLAIRQQEQNEDMLRHAKADAEIASAAKTDFLANMSHELRTPLNSILGFSQILASSVIAQAESKRVEYARDIQKAGKHLLALIEDILDISRIESGESPLFETPCETVAIFDTAYHVVLGMAETRAVAVMVDQHMPSVVFMADKRRIVQVLVNLLSNAIKFNKPGGQVTLSAAMLPDGALSLSVTDSGIGIPERYLAKVFEPFTQVGRTAHVAKEGTGLGLSLTKKLTELHDGKVEMESAEGVGTRVTIVIPAHRVVRVDVASKCAQRALRI